VAEIILRFDEQSGIPKYLQLYRYLKLEISKGRLEPGEKLPSVRVISKALNVSKATVENAYSQLVVEGYVESRPKSGYYVEHLDTHALASKDENEFQKEASAQKQREETAVNANGIEADAFDFSNWRRFSDRILEYRQNELLNYGDVRGAYELRYEIAKFVHQFRGAACHPDQVVIGAGTQYLLGFLAVLFKGKMAHVAFEFPGFSKGMYIFEDYGYQLVKIPLEADGIDVGKLGESRAKLVYVSPSHQYPTGSVMPVQKRIDLLKWARTREGYIIEDDYDSLLRYEGYPVPALQGMKYGERVIYMGSFSKLLIPALRISFMILPKALLPAFSKLSDRYMQSVSTIEQLTLASYMSEGAFERHLRRIRKRFGMKNQLLVEAFKKAESGLEMKSVQLLGKASGLHVMLSVRADIDLERMVEAASQAGIKLESYPDNRILVLSYSGIPDYKIEETVKRLVQSAENAAKKG
jgi:GntR family transcriptional regulator/MocR family aminotransferase